MTSESVRPWTRWVRLGGPASPAVVAFFLVALLVVPLGISGSPVAQRASARPLVSVHSGPAVPVSGWKAETAPTHREVAQPIARVDLRTIGSVPAGPVAPSFSAPATPPAFLHPFTPGSVPLASSHP